VAQTKNSDATLRLAQDNDAEAISSLLHESFAEFASLYNPESFAATAILSQQVSNGSLKVPCGWPSAINKSWARYQSSPRGIRFTFGEWQCFPSPEVNELESCS
jgi:hypothetical protein